MNHDELLHRRTFVKTIAVGALASAITLPRLSAANDRLNLAFIGVGTMGRGHLGAFLGMADVQVVAVCDVVAERRDAAKKTVETRYAAQRGKVEYKGCTTHNDFREVLERKDIDAVVIATPDHWHALNAIHAARAGKHIYCEKPLTRTIGEGRRLVSEVAKAGIVFQTGSQQRSEFGGNFRKAVELIRNGRIGKVKTVRIGVGGPAKVCDLPEGEAPTGTDWDLWLGPAPKRGYSDVLCPKGVHGHFPAWRNYREYAGGGLADMGAHHFDIAQWALDMDGSGPITIEPPEKGDTGLRFVYANGVEMFHGGPSGCTFEGESGKIYVDRGALTSDPGTILTTPLGDDAKKVYRADNQRRNWIECIQSKKPTICPAEVGHRSASVCTLGNIGYWTRKKLTWNPEKETFDDAEANKFVDPAMRGPWKF